MGKTMMCRKICQNYYKNSKILYLSISKACCDIFHESFDFNENICTIPVFDIKKLLCVLFSLNNSNPFSLIILEGISPLLFSIQDKHQANELCKELESLLKRMSLFCNIIVTSNVNSEGNTLASSF